MKMAEESKIRRSRLGIEYLHANANSHVWPFSAVAELIDNAYDPDVMANKIYIDKCQLDDKVCLTVQDNGYGMDFDHLWKMLSFGFSEKGIYQDKDHLPVGQYGNGFKSGSMRLAKDALVFSYKNQDRSACIGFLSQTYLHAVDSEDVILPMITFNDASKKRWRENLGAILEHSVYHQEDNLTDLLHDLRDSGGGTKIVLFNLSKQCESSDDFELDFESDPTDIQLRHDYFGDEIDNEMYYAPSHRYSLKEYCCILFRVPRLKIFIRGKSVRSLFIEKSLSQTNIYQYKFEKKHQTKITIGMCCKSITKSSDAANYGLMLYNKKRLITAYNKIGLQLGKSPSALGVVIIAELNHLTPIHNKQDFKREERPFLNAMSTFREKLKEYWETMEPTIKEESHTKKRKPDWTWVSCDKCNKWRRLSELIDPNHLPEKWYCYMNSDTNHSSCSDPEELEHKDEIQISSRRYRRKRTSNEDLKRPVGSVAPSMSTTSTSQCASGRASSVQGSKQSATLPAGISRSREKSKTPESIVNTLSNGPPATKGRRLSREGRERMKEGNVPCPLAPTETKPANLDLDPPPTETKPANLDLDPPPTETKPANSNLDPPPTKTKPANWDLGHASPRRTLRQPSNTMLLTPTLNNDKGVQTEDSGPASNDFYELEARMNTFKNNVAQLLHRIEPEIDLEAIGDDIESVVQRMLSVEYDSLETSDL